MRLNGIYAFPGTYLGQTPPRRNGMLSIGLIANGGGGGCEHVEHPPFTNLRPATHGELELLSWCAPRSVAEHERLRRIRTPYGLGRTFNPNTKGLGAAHMGWLDKIRTEKKIKIARRRNIAELHHLYRLRAER